MKHAKQLYNEGKYKRALIEFLKEEVEENQYQELAYYLSLCYFRLKEFDDAILYLEQVVSSSDVPSRVKQCRFLMGYAHTELKNYILAEREFRRLLDENPNDYKIFCAITHNLIKQGNYVEAKKLVNKAFELFPNRPRVLNTVAYIMSELDLDKENLKQALILVKKALDVQPNNPAYLDTAGWIYYKMNEYQEALFFLGKANNALPNHPEIKEHLKVVYEKSNPVV